MLGDAVAIKISFQQVKNFSSPRIWSVITLLLPSQVSWSTVGWGTLLPSPKFLFSNKEQMLVHESFLLVLLFFIACNGCTCFPLSHYFSACNRMGECFAFSSVLALRWVGGGWWDRWDRSELWWGQRCSVTEWVWFMLSMSTPLGWTILFSLWSYWTSSGSFCRNSFILRD